jgi:serine/threonine protein kinase/ABC-type branched-subunit amino acid transport system substrate-binding protein
MVSTRCPYCGEQVELEDAPEGQTQPCSHCGKPVPIIAPESPAHTPLPLGQTPLPGVAAPPPDSEKPIPPLETLAVGTPNSAAIDPEYSFLAAPRAPDELGWLAHYRVLGLLGFGGMGLIFHAEDTQLERPVALKVMRPEFAKRGQAVKRFLREARAMAAVRSDHIITIYQVGEHDGLPFLAMELLQGETLETWLEGEPHPPLAQVIHIALQLARGLQTAHERGLIHRDVKPSNVWLEPSPIDGKPGSGRAKILDFGLALPQEDARITQAGTIMGTPAFMSPEQAEGETVDARSDLFSLGCVIYSMATGVAPFSGSSTRSILKAVLLKDPRPPAQVNPAIPPALNSLLMQLLAKDRDMRPASARVVVETLEAIQADPSLPPLTGATTRSGPRREMTSSAGWSKRRWLLVGGGLVGLAGLLILVFIFRGARFGPAPDAPAGSGAASPAAADIVLGMSGPFSGPSKELGRAMQLGIETAFKDWNDRGGVGGRQLHLVALDDGYDPARALANLQELEEQRNVFSLIGNIGTPTTEKVLPYVLDKKIPLFGAFTGAKFLRKEPPDRYVFNYRASYTEETAAVMRYLVEIEKLRPEQVAVFAQQDSYGDAGFQGVAHACRKYGVDSEKILRVGYVRNSMEGLDNAVQTILAHKEIRAVVQVATYRQAARFIQKLKDAKFEGLFTNVSFVGSEALAEELRDLGAAAYGAGVIVTQVVPAIDSHATAVLKYRDLLRKYFPNERPSFVSLEGYLIANLFVEGVQKAGPSLTRESLIEGLEAIHDLDLGIGTPLHFAPSEHQASHKVWATVLTKDGRYQLLDLE